MTFTLPFPYRIGCDGYNAAGHDHKPHKRYGMVWKGMER